MKKTLFLVASILVSLFSYVSDLSATALQSKGKQIYEWHIYTLSEDGAALDSFFKKVLIPAYNRQNVTVGAFSLYKQEDKEQRYLVFVYPDIETFRKVKREIWHDAVFTKAAQPFFDASASKPVYTEYESYLCEAFDKIPTMLMPDKNRTLFEYRLYHSPNDEANQRKVKMFNIEEIDLFDKVGINSVCYGEILAGAHMPALIYLTWYKDETTRNEAWGKFVAHPDWIGMRDKPEYANTATNNTSKLLSPLPYSQF